MPTRLSYDTDGTWSSISQNLLSVNVARALGRYGLMQKALSRLLRIVGSTCRKIGGPLGTEGSRARSIPALTAW